MMCIYFGKNENLTYKSEEHIFPATIGGIETLPKGYVSYEANNYFSKLESHLVTLSFISLHKSFFGPGKRGGNKPGRLPINVICEEAGNEYLGFSFIGKNHFIPQIIIKDDIRQITVTRDRNIQTNEDIENLIKCVKKTDYKYSLIDSDLKNTKFIVGLYENRLYVATNDKNKIEDYFNYIKEYIKPNIDYTQMKNNTTKNHLTKFKMEVSIDDDARVMAKTAINFIAKLKGKDYLNNPNFNEFKEWILGKQNTKFEQLPRNLNISDIVDINSDMHYCLLVNIDKKLSCIVSFYNYWTMGFAICEAFDPFFNNVQAFFCDWRNHKEYSLIDYINKIIMRDDHNERN